MAGEAAAQAQRQPQGAQPIQSQPASPPERQSQTQAQSQVEPQPAPQTQPLVVPVPAQPAGPPPVIEWRPQEPVPIRVVPTPRSEEEIIAERQEREQRSELVSNLTLVVVALVAIGFLQVIVIALQALFLALGLSAVRRPMELMERNLAVAQRAFVFVGSLAARPVDANLKVTPTLENGGATPTKSLRISTNWRAAHGELPTDFVYNYSVPPSRISLPAHGRAEIGSLDIPMRDVQAVLEDRLQLYVWGRATYEDVFEGSEPHFAEFCYRLDVAGSVPNVVVTFTPVGPHNRSEQDSHMLLSPEPASRPR